MAPDQAPIPNGAAQLLKPESYSQGLLAFLTTIMSYSEFELANSYAQPVGTSPWWNIFCPANALKTCIVQIDKNGEPAYYFIRWQEPSEGIPYPRPVIEEVVKNSVGIAGYVCPIVRLRPMGQDVYRRFLQLVALGERTILGAFETVVIETIRPSSDGERILEMMRFSISNEMMETIGDALRHNQENQTIVCSPGIAYSNSARIVGPLRTGVVLIDDPLKFPLPANCYWNDLELSMDLTPDLMGPGAIAKRLLTLTHLVRDAAGQLLR